MSRLHRHPDASTRVRRWLAPRERWRTRPAFVVLAMLVDPQAPYALSSIFEEARVADAKRNACDIYPVVRPPLGQCQLPASDRRRERFETPLLTQKVAISVGQTNTVDLKTRRAGVDWLSELGWAFDHITSACKTTSNCRMTFDEARPRRRVGATAADLCNLRRGAGLRATQLSATVLNEDRMLLINAAGRGKSVLTWLLRGWMAYASRFKGGADGDASECSLRYGRNSATDGRCGLDSIGGAGTAGSAHAIVSLGKAGVLVRPSGHSECVSDRNDWRSAANSAFAGSECDRDLLTRVRDGACSDEAPAVAALRFDRVGGRLPRGSSRFAARPRRHDTHHVSADVRIQCRLARPADRHRPPSKRSLAIAARRAAGKASRRCQARTGTRPHHLSVKYEPRW